MAADEAHLERLERLERLQRQVDELARAQAHTLSAALALGEGEEAEAAARKEAADGALWQALKQEEACRSEVAELEADLEEYQLGKESGDEGSAAAQQLATLEEEAAVLLGRLEVCRALEQRREAALNGVRQAAAAHACAAADWAAAQQAQCRGEEGLRLARAAGPPARLREALAVEVRQLHEALAAQEAEAQAAEGEVQRCSKRAAALQEEQLRLAAAAKSAPTAGRETALLQELAVQRSRQQAAVKRERQLGAEAAALRAQLAARGPATPPPGCRPLHACFSFRDPEACQPYREALEVLAGCALHTLVADTTTAAGAALAACAGRGLRVWPLDALRTADRTVQQRAAAAAFDPGQVVVPVDLLEFDICARPAVLRAFGCAVITASDAVAAQLAACHGLACVTLDGRLHSRGSLTGGWRGSSSGAGLRQAGPLHAKLHLDVLQQARAAAGCEVAQAGAAVRSAEEGLAGARAAREAAGAATMELAAVDSELQRCMRELQGARAGRAAAAAAAQRLRTCLEANQALARLAEAGAEGGRPGEGGASQAAMAVEAVEAEVGRLRLAAARLERCVADAEAARAAAAEEAETAEAAAVAAEQGQGLEALVGALAQRQAAAEGVRVALAQQHADAAAAAAGVWQRCKELRRRRAALHLAGQDVALAEGELAAAAQVLESAAAAAARLREQLGALLLEAPELVATTEEGGQEAAAVAHAGSLAAALEAASSLARRRAAALAERASAAAGARALSLAEQQEMRGRRASLAAMRRQAATLELAASRLEEGIAGASPQARLIVGKQ